MKIRLSLPAVLALLPAAVASAHEGHGHTPIGEGETFWHYVASPSHLPLWIAATVAIALSARVAIKFARRPAHQANV